MTTERKVALKEYKAVVLEQRQAQNLEFAGVDPALYGGTVADLSIVGNECFRAIAAAGRPLDGFIHTESRFRIGEPLPIDQVIFARGTIEEFVDTPKGTRVHYRFELQVHNRAKPSGAIDIIGLQSGDGMLKHVPKTPVAAAAGTPPKPALDPFLGYKAVAKHQLTPGLVERYSRYVGNRVHHDPVFANKLGLKAPVAQGFMQLTMMLGIVAKSGPPKSLDLTIKFPRPCFWTDEVTVWAHEKAPGVFVGLKTSTAAGKPTAEASIAAIGR